LSIERLVLLACTLLGACSAAAKTAPVIRGERRVIVPFDSDATVSAALCSTACPAPRAAEHVKACEEVHVSGAVRDELAPMAKGLLLCHFAVKR
jgi:hypothetical protein